MATDKLNEIYDRIYADSPFAEFESEIGRMKESELFNLWQHRNQASHSESSRSFGERIAHFFQDPRVARIFFFSAILLIVFGIILLLIAKLQGKTDKPDDHLSLASTPETGTITNIMYRSQGRQRKRYGLIEFYYNGFNYTLGSFLPDSPDYDVGKQIPVFVNTRDPRKSQLTISYQIDTSPLRSIAMWLVIIGIAILLCTIL